MHYHAPTPWQIPSNFVNFRYMSDNKFSPDCDFSHNISCHQPLHYACMVSGSGIRSLKIFLTKMILLILLVLRKWVDRIKSLWFFFKNIANWLVLTNRGHWKWSGFWIWHGNHSIKKILLCFLMKEIFTKPKVQINVVLF